MPIVTKEFVRVFPTILEIHILDVGQNVWWIAIVLQIKPVLISIVSIHAPEYVDRMLDAM